MFVINISATRLHYKSHDYVNNNKYKQKPKKKQKVEKKVSKPFNP